MFPILLHCYYCHYYRDNVHYLLSHCTTRYMNYFTCDVKLELQENCAINAPSGYSFETAVIVILFAISGFTSNDRAPGGPCDNNKLIFSSLNAFLTFIGSDQLFSIQPRLNVIIFCTLRLCPPMRIELVTAKCVCATLSSKNLKNYKYFL